MPFAVRAIWVDGCSRFEVIFEGGCQRRSTKLFVLPPLFFKLNGHVKWAHRTHGEEFYEVTKCEFTIFRLRWRANGMRACIHACNTVIPNPDFWLSDPAEVPGEVEGKSEMGGDMSLLGCTSTHYCFVAPLMVFSKAPHSNPAAESVIKGLQAPQREVGHSLRFSHPYFTKRRSLIPHGNGAAGIEQRLPRCGPNRSRWSGLPR